LENSSGQGFAICTVDRRPQQVSELFLPTLSTPEQVEDGTIGEKGDGGKRRGKKKRAERKINNALDSNRATNDF
jgi:hypothetical protein